MRKLRVVVYNMDEPEKVVTIASVKSEAEGRSLMKLFRNPHSWNIERRPYMDTFDRIAMKLLVEHGETE